MSYEDLAQRLRSKLLSSIPRLNETTEHEKYTLVYQKLFFAITNEGKLYDVLFPNISEADRLKTWDDTDLLHGTSHFIPKEKSFAHPGRNCGRKFGVGEPIYRCAECAYDNTCVLCVRCFNKDDHRGHQVSASICSEDNGGICDCGDPEAWTKEIHCKASFASIDHDHSENVTSQNKHFDDDFNSLLRAVFTVCLELVIEIFEHQSQSLFELRGFLDDGGVDLFQKDIECAHNVFEPDSNDLLGQKYVLLFWNDEYHNFPQASGAIISSSGCSSDEADRIAEVIDKEGRCVLKEEESIEALIRGFRNAIDNDFTATIITKNDFLRQETAKFIIKWFNDVIQHPNTKFQTMARRVFCEVICGDYLLPSEKRSIWHLYAPFWKAQKEIGHGVLPEKPLDVVSTRLQYLLFFDIRFWKTIRRQLHDLLVSTLVSDLEYKLVSCRQIVRLYPTLIFHLRRADREPHLNITEHISSQYFTCPTNTTMIVENELSGFMDTLYLLFKNSFALNWGLKYTLILPRTREDDASLAKKITYRRALQDMEYIFENSNSLKQLYEQRDCFTDLCRIINIFDGCWKIKRKVGEHVHNESFEFASYFDAVISLIDVISAATNFKKLDDTASSLKSCVLIIQKTILLTHNWKNKEANGHLIPEFVVSREMVSFLNPSNIILAKLLSRTVRATADLKMMVEPETFLNVADVSLRSIVLCSQIESHFWVRNGSVVLNQALTYKTHGILRDEAYANDIYLIQVLLMIVDPSRGFLNILDRFELLDWFLNNVSLENTVYSEKIISMIEKILCVLYILLSERTLFIDFDDDVKRERYKCKNILLYLLYSKPLTYSDLEDHIHLELLESKMFEEVLNEIAVFAPPKGLNDDGRYSLKPEFFKHIDPLKMGAQTRDFQDSIAIITKELAKCGKSSEEIVLEPKLHKLENFRNLGDFTRTQDFSKFLIKLLDYAIEKKEESYLPYVLHLLHAAVKDDEMVNGKEHLIYSHLQLPFAEALFNISFVSSFSKPTTKKADHLLEKMIVKDSPAVFETLVACFGDALVDKYKEKKKSSGIDFDETEPERKRRLAKERQKKLLSRMQKKQKQFIENNGFDSVANEDEEAEHIKTEQRVCVLCQNQERSNQALCMPVSTITSTISRNLPVHDKEFMRRAFTDWGDDSIPSKLDVVGKAFPICNPGDASFNVRSDQIVTSCNHGIHHGCLRAYMTQKNLRHPSFSCPLCQTKHDTYLPILLKKRHATITDLEYKEDDKKYDDMSTKLLMELHESYGLSGGLDMDQALEMSFRNDADDYKKLYRRIKQAGYIFSSTIAQSEIATRINGDDAYSGFLEQIPEQTFRTLKSYSQYLFLIQMEVEPSKKMKAKYMSQLLDSGRFIDAFVIYYLSGRDGFKVTAMKILKYFAKKYTFTLLKQFERHGEYDLTVTDEYGTDDLSLYRMMIADQSIFLEEKTRERFVSDDRFASQVVHMVNRLLLPDVRGLAIFFKIFVPDFAIQSPGNTRVGIDQILQALSLDTLKQILSKSSGNVALEHPANDWCWTLPYPGVTKLVDLPSELSYFTTISDDSCDQSRFPAESVVNNGSNRIDYVVCLACGHKVFKSADVKELHLHISRADCSSQGGCAFLIPNTDSIKLVALKGQSYYRKVINAPYLNSHGQSGPKAVHNGRVAKLNVDRYRHLNNLWLTGGIYPFLTRNSMPSRFTRMGLEDGIENRFWQQFLRAATTQNGGLGNGLVDPGTTPGFLLNLVQDQMEGIFGDQSDDEQPFDDDDYDDDDDDDNDDDDNEDDEDDYDDDGEFSGGDPETVNFNAFLRRYGLDVEGGDDDEGDEDYTSNDSDSLYGDVPEAIREALHDLDTGEIYFDSDEEGEGHRDSDDDDLESHEDASFERAYFYAGLGEQLRADFPDLYGQEDHGNSDNDSDYDENAYYF